MKKMKREVIKVTMENWNNYLEFLKKNGIEIDYSKLPKDHPLLKIQ